MKKSGKTTAYNVPGTGTLTVSLPDSRVPIRNAPLLFGQTWQHCHLRGDSMTFKIKNKIRVYYLTAWQVFLLAAMKDNSNDINYRGEWSC